MKKLNNNVLYGEQRERINGNFDKLAMRTDDLQDAIDKIQVVDLPTGLLKSRNLDPRLVTTVATFSTETVSSGAFDTRPNTATHFGFVAQDWLFGDFGWWGSGNVDSLFPNGMMLFDHTIRDAGWREKNAAIDNVTAISFRVRDRVFWRQVVAEATIDSIEPVVTADGFETIKITGTVTARFSEMWSGMHDPEFNFTLYVGAQANVDNTIVTMIDASRWGNFVSGVWYEITNAPEGRNNAWVFDGIYIAAEGGTNTFVTGESYSLSLGQTLEPNEMLGINCEFATTYSGESGTVDITRNINLAMLPVGATSAETFPIFMVERYVEGGIGCQHYMQGHAFATLTADSLNFCVRYGRGVDKAREYFWHTIEKTQHSFNIKRLVAISKTEDD